MWDFGVTEALGIRKDTSKAFGAGYKKPAAPLTFSESVAKNQKTRSDAEAKFKSVTGIDPSTFSGSTAKKTDSTPTGSGSKGSGSKSSGSGSKSSGGSKTSGKTSQQKEAEKQADIMKKAQEQANKLRNEQMSSSEAAFTDMLNSLDPLYNGYRSNMKKEYDTTQADEVEQLAARMRANGTEDSEQRNQMQERIGTTYADKYNAFLEKLATQESTQRATIGGQRNSALNAIREGRISDEYKGAQDQLSLIQQAFQNDLASQQNARANASSAREGAGSGTSKVGSFINGLASAAMDGKSGNPYATPNLREGIFQQAANQFGGSPVDYATYLPDGWEGMFATGPKADPAFNPITGQLTDRSTGSPIGGGGGSNGQVDAKGYPIGTKYDENGRPYRDQ